MSGLRRRVAALEREASQREPVAVPMSDSDFSELAVAVAASIELYSDEQSARGYCWRSLGEVIEVWERERLEAARERS